VRALALTAALVLVTGCADNRRYAQAVSVLVDVSGTYADQKPQVVELVKAGILPGLQPGDSIMLITIDGESYEQDNLQVSVTLDARPSHANAQKLAFAKHLDAFAESRIPAKHTDIQGAMMLAAERLRETKAGTQTIVAFSDMKQDLPAGYKRSFDEEEFGGMRVAAVNVKQLAPDNSDPNGYRDRLASWGERVTQSGAEEWRVIADGLKLSEYVSQRL
jgi:hypothetical protein